MTALTDLETPAVAVHLEVMEDNIRRVQAHLDRLGIANRPHDAGSKVLTSDLYHMKGYGHLMEYAEARVAHRSEEHAMVDLSGCAQRPTVGEVVSMVPNRCCVVTNMVDEVFGVRDGAVEVTWPVAARGRVR
jgi:D-serine deaminase-like pyridoxal phosphate-dependent protein